MNEGEKLKLQNTISERLEGIFVWNDKVLTAKEKHFDQVVLKFKKKSLLILPLADTDEVSIQVESNNNLSFRDAEVLSNNFVGKKLQAYWICHNDKNYEDMVVFSFDYCRPSFALYCEASVIKFYDMILK